MDNTNNNFNIQTLSVFKESPILGYIYKKTERLVSAVYLLSNIISDKEPIKWQLRETALGLIFKSQLPSDRNTFITSILSLISVLEIAHISGLISDMNFSVIKGEFERLIIVMEEEKEKNYPRVISFPEHLFTAPDTGHNSTSPVDVLCKGHNNLSDRARRPIGLMAVKKEDKSNRQEVIISLLNKNKELGIKDFTSSIKDCSEKTIQRELASLVSKGLVKKQGEKRWSRYSLR